MAVTLPRETLAYDEAVAPARSSSRAWRRFAFASEE